MKRARIVGLVVLLSSVGASARARDPWHAVIARVRVEARRDRVRVTTDVVVWSSARRPPALSVYAAYGAPGPPLAADAQLLAVPRGYLDAPDGSSGQPLPLHFSATAPRSSELVLGSPRMAGSTITVGTAPMAATLAPSGAACLRLSTVRPMPPPGPNGAREIVVRLGTRAGAPLVLDEVEVTGEHVARRDVELCEGAHAPDRSLEATPVRHGERSGVTPALARRTASDALCVRLWLGPN